VVEGYGRPGVGIGLARPGIISLDQVNDMLYFYFTQSLANVFPFKMGHAGKLQFTEEVRAVFKIFEMIRIWETFVKLVDTGVKRSWQQPLISLLAISSILKERTISPEISVLLTISDVLNFHFSDFFGPFWDHPLTHFVKNN
jgi:hypothetical protein